MELTLNIDEKKFNDLLQGELDNFSQEELHEICKEGFMKCLSNEDTFRKLFVKESGSYSYNNTHYYAGELLQEAAKKVDLNPLFADFQQNVLTYLQLHHEDIIKKLMSDIFINGFSQYLYNSHFMEALKDEFSMQLALSQQQNDAKIYNAINSLR